MTPQGGFKIHFSNSTGGTTSTGLVPSGPTDCTRYLKFCYSYAVGRWPLASKPCAGIPRPFTRVADLPSRRSLRSVDTNRLVVPTSRLSTVGSRAFPVAVTQTWNDLPEDVTSAESLATFRCLFKTHLFRKSFPDYLLDINWLSPVDLAVGPLL